jgi:penicillin-binding protein 1A
MDNMPAKRSKGKKKKNKSGNGTKQQFSLRLSLLKLILVAGFWLAVALGGLVAYYAYDLPDVRKLNEEKVRTPNIRIVDRNGDTMASVGALYGDYVKYEDLPKHLIDAVTSIEDRRFFKHFGVDPWGLTRAAFVNWRAGHVVQGGSTITQQLAKITFLSPDRTFKRKIQEVMLALSIENHFTKKEIITMYLNRIYLGSGNYGVDAASRTYFGKKVNDITLYESAIIAGLIKAPSLYSPINNLEISEKRTEQVIDSMRDNGAIPKNYKKSGGFNPVYSQTRRNMQATNPYFVDWIKEQLNDYIGEESGEIIVTTTLDPKLQKMAETAVARQLAKTKPESHVSQAAMTVVTPHGEVLAMVGGKSYAESQFNRAVQAHRQPGSSFKLFVYLAALESGFTPDDVLIDEPIKMKKWSPSNWNGKYVGAVTLRDALAGSINTISIKLAQQVGIGSIINMAEKLGITSEMNHDLSSALGTSEVNLLELTGAYAHVANNGNAVWVYGIKSIKTGDSRVIYERQDSGDRRVISGKATEEMQDMLENVINNGTAKAAKLDRRAGGKTGTTQDYKDAWFIGYTRDLVAGVWVGNDDATPMKKVGGGGLPAVIWKDFMVAANAGRPENDSPMFSGEAISGAAESIWNSIVNGFGESAKPGVPAQPWRDPGIVAPRALPADSGSAQPQAAPENGAVEIPGDAPSEVPNTEAVDDPMFGAPTPEPDSNGQNQNSGSGNN